MTASLALLLASSALAQSELEAFGADDFLGEDIQWIDESDPEAVVGGTQVEEGDWDDTVGIVFYSAYVGCTGTLIAKDVVLTAGHCVGGISHVLVGSKNWYSEQGEIIEVEASHEYPNSWSSYDIAVLKLVEKSSYKPRAVAIDCIVDDYLDDGVDVSVVGFGMTNEQGTASTSRLHEGVTQIQDMDCDETFIDGVFAGCQPSVSPGGEIGAGGNEVDACFGDSGGPLYLLTPEGDFVVGVTSRAYAGVNPGLPCKDGGIYVRPDAVIDWIEEVAERKVTYPSCNEAPEVIADDIVTTVGQVGTTAIGVNDVDGDSATFAVGVDPEFGTVEILEDGTVQYTPADDFIGTDSFIVEVTDDGVRPYKKRAGAPITVDVEIFVQVDEEPPEIETGLASGSCACSSGSAGGGWWLALAGAMAFVRRRHE